MLSESPSPPAATHSSSRKKALERRQKSFSLLCSAEFESLKGAPEGELNKKKAIMGSLWCDQSTFSVSLNGYIIYRRIHFFITHELEPPLFYLPPKKVTSKSRETM